MRPSSPRRRGGLAIAAGGILVSTALAALLPAGSVRAGAPPPRRVLIVSMAGVTWEDVAVVEVA